MLTVLDDKNYDGGKENITTLQSINDGNCIEAEREVIDNGDCVTDERCKIYNEHTEDLVVCLNNIAVILNNLDNEETNSDKEGCADGTNQLQIVPTETSPNQQTLIGGENENVILSSSYCDITGSQLHIETLSSEIHSDDKIDNGDKQDDNVSKNYDGDKQHNNVSNNYESEQNVVVMEDINEEHVSEDGDNKMQSHHTENEGDNDNEDVADTPQECLKTEDSKKEEISEGEDDERQYDDYVIISSDDVKITESDDNNEAFIEIALSDVYCDNSVDGNSEDFPEEKRSIQVKDNSENEASEIISENETSQAFSENETLSTNDETSKDLSDHDQSENDTSKAPFDKESTKKLKKEKITHVFPVNADINITLRYSVDRKDILGNIRSVKGLGYNENNPCPQYICFHVTILPENIYRVNTKWVHASTHALAWKFLIGPLSEEINPKGNIRFRLYGRSKVLVCRCYGECFVALEEVVEAEKSIVFEQTILPKGSLKNMNIKCRKKTTSKSTSTLQGTRNSSTSQRRTKSMQL